MINQLVQKLFGTKHERELKKMQPLVAQIGTLEKRFEKLSDDELRGHTASFKERIAKGESPACARSACGTTTCSLSAAS